MTQAHAQVTLAHAVNPSQRALLATWLRNSATGARGALFEQAFPEMDAQALDLLLREVRATHAKYRGAPSVLIAPVPEQLRGSSNARGPVRPVSDGLEWRLSLWERAFIAANADVPAAASNESIAQLAGNDAERLKAVAAFTDLRVELFDLFGLFPKPPVLDTAGVFLLTSTSLDEARARASAIAFTTRTSLMWTEGGNDRDPWIHWLAGTPGATLPTVAATDADSPAVLAALRGEWAQVNELTPLKERRTHLRPIRVASEETMLTHMLRQLWTHREGAGPTADVLRKSLAALFSHWGSAASDPWHAGLRVGVRLPLLGLVARFCAVAGDVVDPLALLYEQRAHNPHLVTPPVRTFTIPPDVDEAFTAYEAVLEAAIALGGRFTRAFDDGGHTLRLVQVAPPEPPRAPEDPYAGVNGGLRFRCVVNDRAGATFALPVIPGETVAALKERMGANASTPGAEFCALSSGGRYLKLVESVDALLGKDGGASIDVVWTTCSHSAPANPMTGASTCFWDGSGGPVENPEY